jgi:hypothetical protein
MDPNASPHEEKLSAFERRLAEWRPDSEGLQTDQMLYAAGLAAGKQRRVQIAWPALCLFLTLTTLASLAWGLVARSVAQPMAIPVHRHGLDANGSGITALTSAPAYTPAPNDYLHLRQQIETNPAGWLASSQQSNQQDSKSVPMNSDILKAGQFDRWRDQ